MSPLLHAIIAAVREAASIAQKPFLTEEKGEIRNLVTTADRDIEIFLRAKLQAILPEAGFIGEEENERFAGSLYFALDPIDGTTNFSRGNQYCCISVGLVKDNRPILGVVYAFHTDTLYYAEENGGAFVNGHPIHVSGRDWKSSILFTAFSLYHAEYATACMKILNNIYPTINDFRRHGSAALELCEIAAGEGELYFEMRLYPWDGVAGLCILAEAGGCYASPITDTINFARPFTLIAANSTDSLARLCTAVQKELPTLRSDFYDI